jgi:hypothetical protein
MRGRLLCLQICRCLWSVSSISHCFLCYILLIANLCPSKTGTATVGTRWAWPLPSWMRARALSLAQEILISSVVELLARKSSVVKLPSPWLFGSRCRLLMLPRLQTVALEQPPLLSRLHQVRIFVPLPRALLISVGNNGVSPTTIVAPVPASAGPATASPVKPLVSTTSNSVPTSSPTKAPVLFVGAASQSQISMSVLASAFILMAVAAF